MHAPEVHLACARPTEFAHRDIEAIERLLSEEEREAMRRLRFEADRRAFAVVHALLRALVANDCEVDAAEIELRHDTRGMPFIARHPDLHVSLSRTRTAVACAVTRTAPIGVDVECIESRPIDAGLLGAFVIAPQPVTTKAFFFHWTALEAFWKACGTGLVDANPRILCMPRNASRFDVHLERSNGLCAGRGAVVHAYDDCALAVVLRAPADPDFVLKRTNCGSASDINQLSRAHAAHERFFAA
ncbi:4'-phosphopantetheinyl transferase family protein [Ramlibacter sp. PS4R-6]|uniref:4'-phosphopantetheinyl transferase family protein n=1 Tax=Ramlibacter sp. PS4R-6 TaxID=3133438 RepID=UPI0030970440